MSFSSRLGSVQASSCILKPVCLAAVRGWYGILLSSILLIVIVVSVIVIVLYPRFIAIAGPSGYLNTSSLGLSLGFWYL